MPYPAVATTPHRPLAAPLSARIAGARPTSAAVAKQRGQNPNEVTTAELVDLIRPFVGAKLNPPRDPATGYVRHRTSAIDIHHASDRMDADVRSISAEGVEDFFYRDTDLVPWSAIRGITISSLDEYGNRTAETRYVHIGEARRAAA